MTDAIDMSVVQELLDLCDDGDPELLVDLIGMFLEDGPQRVQAVRTGHRAGDLETVERAAHSLKGSAGNLGAVKVQNVSEELQNAAREQKDPATIEKLATELEQTFDEAFAALRELHQRYRPS